MRPHIVILGAGFGGMYVAKKLISKVKKREIDVTIVNRTNYFLFTPLLHEVATGGLSPRSVAEPLREVFAKTGVRVVQGTVEKIEPSTHTVYIKGHIGTCSLKYDQLVVAAGAESNYYGIPGADKYTMPLKTLNDAYLIRNKVIDLFEQAVIEPDVAKRRELLSFVVVGGGATGVEVAAELAEFITGIVNRYYKDTEGLDEDGSRADDLGRCHPEEPTVTLIHAGNELLEQFSPKLRMLAEKRLLHNGIQVLVGSTVKTVTEEGLTLADNRVIKSSLIIWSAGVKPLIPEFGNFSPTLTSGRLAVDEYFRILKTDNIFALGDVAAYTDSLNTQPSTIPDKTARPLPMLAQVAVAEARTVAKNILAGVYDKKLKNFHYKSKGSMVSVGQWFAVGEIFSLGIAGRLTWWLWRTVYLFKFASWSKRIQIAFEWTLGLLYSRDITKLT